MTRHILAIAGCFPSLYPRATRPLAEDELVPVEGEQYMLRELEKKIYIHEVCDSGCICYLPEDVVLDLIRRDNWREIHQSAAV